jgi:8-oxo-dGTP diphosphatase
VGSNLRAVVVGLVEREGEVLIARKRAAAGHFLSGRWHVPGGRVEEGESLEHAVTRELREEAGIEVEVLECVGIVELEQQGVRAHWFRCAPLTDDLRAGDDVVEVEYVAPAEAVRRFPRDSAGHFPDAVKKYFGLVSPE